MRRAGQPLSRSANADTFHSPAPAQTSQSPGPSSSTNTQGTLFGASAPSAAKNPPTRTRYVVPPEALNKSLIPVPNNDLLEQARQQVAEAEAKETANPRKIHPAQSEFAWRQQCIKEGKGDPMANNNTPTQVQLRAASEQ
ncbi:hypothetical protein LTR17_025646 [Elasticomyces elasticus]|nr:hypothetical protein LTR17_025646 [Elasticomyces elasticus]